MRRRTFTAPENVEAYDLGRVAFHKGASLKDGNPYAETGKSERLRWKCWRNGWLDEQERRLEVNDVDRAGGGSTTQTDLLPLAPFSNLTTSLAAARRVAPRVLGQRERVLNYVRLVGGATADEVEVALDMRAQSVTPRLVELVNAGKLRDSGQTRNSRRGYAGAVYVPHDGPPLPLSESGRSAGAIRHRVAVERERCAEWVRGLLSPTGGVLQGYILKRRDCLLAAIGDGSAYNESDAKRLVDYADEDPTRTS